MDKQRTGDSFAFGLIYECLLLLLLLLWHQFHQLELWTPESASATLYFATAAGWNGKWKGWLNLYLIPSSLRNVQLELIRLIPPSFFFLEYELELETKELMITCFAKSSNWECEGSCLESMFMSVSVSVSESIVHVHCMVVMCKSLDNIKQTPTPSICMYMQHYADTWIYPGAMQLLQHWYCCSMFPLFFFFF